MFTSKEINNQFCKIATEFRKELITCEEFRIRTQEITKNSDIAVLTHSLELMAIEYTGTKERLELAKEQYTSLLTS